MILVAASLIKRDWLREQRGAGNRSMEGSEYALESEDCPEDHLPNIFPAAFVPAIAGDQSMMSTSDLAFRAIDDGEKDFLWIV